MCEREGGGGGRIEGEEEEKEWGEREREEKGVGVGGQVKKEDPVFKGWNMKIPNSQRIHKWTPAFGDPGMLMQVRDAQAAPLKCFPADQKAYMIRPYNVECKPDTF